MSLKHPPHNNVALRSKPMKRIKSEILYKQFPSTPMLEKKKDKEHSLDVEFLHQASIHLRRFMLKYDPAAMHIH
jgi:hypothetical protein